MLCLVFISTTAMAISSGDFGYVKQKEIKPDYSSFAPIPVLKDNAAEFPVLSAQSVLVYDPDSGISLYEKDPDKPIYPASTTKIVTALVALDNYPLDGYVKVPKFYIEGQKMGLVAGEKIKIIDLLYGMLVYSGNDAAEELARIYPEGRQKFIDQMNQKAKDLGMKNTYFVNPVGLDGNYSSAKDMVVASIVAMRDPNFREIVNTQTKTVSSIDNLETHKLVNVNQLLGKVDGVMGIKTGWTENARENLITYVERGDKKIYIALLGSQDRFGETKELIDWAFDNYTWKKISSYSAAI